MDTGKPAEAARACGEKAFMKETPFYIAFDEGNLSSGAWGFAVDRSGTVHDVAFDEKGSLRDERNSDQAPKPSHSALDVKLRELAGENAMSCGHIALGMSSKDADRCARNASDRRMPFLVAYDRWGECCGSWGLAQNARGRMYSVRFHSAGFGKLPINDAIGEERSPDSRLSVTPCPEFLPSPKGNPFWLLDVQGGGVMVPSAFLLHDKPPIGLTCFSLGK
jgi:hypothetical protein